MDQGSAVPVPPIISRGICFLAQSEFWLVSALVFASMLSTRFLPAAVYTAAGFWLIRLLMRWLGENSLKRRTPGDWGVLLMLLTVPVTLAVATQPDVTRVQVYRLLTGIALYYAIASYAIRLPQLKLMITGISLGGALLALIAPFSVEWATGKVPLIPAVLYERFSLLVSDTIHPNVLAGSLAILCPLALGWLLFTWKDIHWASRLMLVISAGLMLGMTGLTQSRGAWLATAAAILGLVILRWRWGWTVILPAAVGLAGLVYTQGIATPLQFILSSGQLIGLAGRMDIWQRALFMIQDFPFTGIGMGSFTQVTNLLYPFSAAPSTIDHAHNLFLQIGVDLGIAGLIAWLAIFLGMLASAWSLYRQGMARGNRFAAGLGAGLFCSQIALAVHGLTDAVTWGMVRPAPLVWALWGITAAAYAFFSSQNKTE
ncbi:MAG: O-antigen ligase family protein [Anaerolineales bacterium]|nr:O-antigen ligase family protein [Anaerolineales bacterium]